MPPFLSSLKISITHNLVDYTFVNKNKTCYLFFPAGSLHILETPIAYSYFQWNVVVLVNSLCISTQLETLVVLSRLALKLHIEE